jgi:hypothetical protein
MTVAANRSIGSAADVARLCATAGTARPFSPADPIDSPEISAPNSALTKTIKFEFSFDGPELPLARQKEFESDFQRELARCKTWAADQSWSAGPVPSLHVVVSDRFRISKSLVPAWSGHAGRMEFPAWRVQSRKAAIAHELIHVLFPNGNRLLAEGLAVHLQAEIGGNPAFPNFGKPLHGLVRELLPGLVPGFRPGEPASLEPIRLAELDAIATPGPLTLRVGADFYGEEPRGQAHLYPLAGSFVQHLIETRGLPSFRSLYERTPLMPLHQAAGSPDRWSEIYGVSLSGLESEWKAMIADQ